MCAHCMNRREFQMMAGVGLATGAWGVASDWHGAGTHSEGQRMEVIWDPDRPPIRTGQPLRVQPVLAHALMERREKTSWRSWSEIIHESAATEELQRIGRELQQLQGKADFPIQLLPPVKVTSLEQAANVHQGDFDVILLYAASHAGLFRASCAADPRRDTIVFVRHKSGPTYYGYECIGTRFFPPGSPDLWQRNSADNHGGVTLDDVVVDDYEDVLWRMRAFYGLKNFIGQRIVALGGAGGKYDSAAPQVARQRYKLQMIEVSYEELAARLKALLADPKAQARYKAWTERYLTIPATRLATKREFIERAFALYEVFRQWMAEHEAPAITINACMGTILGVSNTTACLPLSWLNDEGYLAFCESDFVVVPAGILLHYIAGKPVFMHNSTFPHKRMVTCAHCTAPRRMDGKRYEPVQLMTHYESDFGAAPKVEMPIGQVVCAISPEYTKPRWVGIRGTVRDNPHFAICRSQQDVELDGRWQRLIAETRDSHWMMAYGDYLQEIGYAVRKIGLVWDNIASPDA